MILYFGPKIYLCVGANISIYNRVMRKKFIRLTCKICDKTFAQEVRFLEHLTTQHNLDTSSIEKCENLYIQFELNGQEKLCKCGCGKRVKFKNWKKGYESEFVRGHNAIEQGNFTDPENIKKNVEKRLAGFKEGKYKVWNNGLTQETDIRIKTYIDKMSKTLRSRYDSGEIISWQTGLTKETDERIAKACTTKKERGVTGWCKGLTKETDERLAKIGRKVSEHYADMSVLDAGRRIKIADLKSIIESIGLFTIEDQELLKYRNVYTMLPFKCNKCGNIQMKNISMLKNSPRCFNCNPRGSMDQQEIFDFVKDELKFEDAIYNDRKIIFPQELDIYIPSRNFEIEYNGLYWHSFAFLKDKSHQVNKLNNCKEKDIKLLTIYADEWKFKKSLFKNIIKDQLNVIDRKSNNEIIYAVPSNEQCIQFLTDYSIDSINSYDLAFCTLNNNNISSIMTFSLINNFYHLNNVAKDLCYDDNILYSLLMYCRSQLGNISIESNDMILKCDQLIESGFDFVSTRYQMWDTNFVNRVEIQKENEKKLSDSKTMIYGNFLKKFVCHA